MSVSIDEVKAALRVVGDGHDDRLQSLIDSAEQEALRFLGMTSLPTQPDDGEDEEPVPSSSEPVLPDVKNALILIVQADFDGDAEKRDSFIAAAFNILRPYRRATGFA